MRRLAVILLALLPLSATAQDSAPPTVPFQPLNAAEVTLGDYLWLARPVVVFADAAADPRFVQQMELLAETPEALAERDVVVIIDTDPKAMTSVRTKLRPRGFMMVIMDKDGSVVLRKPVPWSIREITHAIDKLPLRKEELLRGRTATH